MGIDRLDTLFHPASVAVVGASDRPGSVGLAVMHNLVDSGFEGPVYPINPRHATITGRHAFSSMPSGPNHAAES